MLKIRCETIVKQHILITKYEVVKSEFKRLRVVYLKHRFFVKLSIFYYAFALFKQYVKYLANSFAIRCNIFLFNECKINVI